MFAPKKIGVNNFVGTYVIVSVYDVGGVRGWQTFSPGLEWTLIYQITASALCHSPGNVTTALPLLANFFVEKSVRFLGKQ